LCRVFFILWCTLHRHLLAAVVPINSASLCHDPLVRRADRFPSTHCILPYPYTFFSRLVFPFQLSCPPTDRLFVSVIQHALHVTLQHRQFGSGSSHGSELKLNCFSRVPKAKEFYHPVKLNPSERRANNPKESFPPKSKKKSSCRVFDKYTY
jgi:hypothetical protein